MMKIGRFATTLRGVGRSFGLFVSALLAGVLFSAACGGSDFTLKEVGKIDLPINAQAIAWHPDSKTIAAGGFSGMLTVWDAESGQLIRDLKQTNGVVGSLEFSRDGKLLGVGKGAVRRGGYLTVLDTTTYEVTEERESPNVFTGRVSPDLRSLSVDPKSSKKIAVPGYEQQWDPVIFLIGRDKREKIAIPPKPRLAVQKVIFSPTQEILAVGRITGLVDFYSSEDGRLLKSFAAYDDWYIRALVFSPDGKFVYTGSNTGSGHEYLDKSTGQWHKRHNNGPIKMWDVQALKLVRTFDPEGDAV